MYRCINECLRVVFGFHFSVYPEFDAVLNMLIIIHRKLLKYLSSNVVHQSILCEFAVTYDATRDAAGPKKPYFECRRGVRKKHERLLPSREVGKLFCDQNMTSYIPVKRKRKRRRRRRRTKRRRTKRRR